MARISPLLLLLLVSACGNLSESDQQAVKEALSDSLAYISESWDINVSIIEHGLRKVDITAPYGTSKESDSGTEMTLTGPVNVTVRDTSGAMEVEIRSDAARYSTREGQFIFDGNVRARTFNNKRLTAEYLVWYQKTGDISSPGFVRIVTPTDSIEGRGLLGKADLSVYELLDLSGTIELEKNDE